MDVRINQAMKMIRLKERIRGVLLDLYYDTNDNFLHHQLYITPADVYLQLTATVTPEAVQKD